MTALDKFFERHGLDKSLTVTAKTTASAALVTALMTVATPANSTDSFVADRDSPIGGHGMSVRTAMIAQRMNDRIRDMVLISRALKSAPEFTNPRDGRFSAQVLINLEGQLYENTPFPELAKFDFTDVPLPQGLAEGAAMEYAVSAINFQKDTLKKATVALEEIVAGFQTNSTRTVERAASKLDDALSDYGVSEPRVLESINSALEDMKTNDGWVRGQVVY